MRTAKAIVGVDDPSISDIPPIDTFSIGLSAPAMAAGPSSSTTPDIDVLVPPTPGAGRSSRLKRRARAGSEAPANPILAGLQKELADADLPQPPLKKFKALFDQTDPDRLGASSPAETGETLFSGGIVEESETYSQMRTEMAGPGPGATGAGLGLGVRSGLGVVLEEEENESAAGPVPPRPAGEDVDMDNIPVTQTPASDGRSVKPASKSAKPASTAAGHTRPTTFDSSQVHRNGASSSDGQGSGGAAPGKPDKDEAFLKALASTKRGKKHEDEFDREFNNLRISKPDADREQQIAEWDVLADFGDDTHVRGNFMVIVEMDVPEHRANSRDASHEPERAEWRGKPDFKAFKKVSWVRTWFTDGVVSLSVRCVQKNVRQSQSTVELIVDTENDYGMGSGVFIHILSTIIHSDCR